ncbi:hypothetical protein MRBLMR1_005919 [Neorhizobium sp. LMR1-1-1.1]
MSPKSMQNRRILVISAVAALLATTATTTEASPTWIPDLVFPETVPAPMAKPERTVTGSTAQDNKTSGARQIGSGTAPKAMRKEPSSALTSKAKEAQR